MHVAVVALRGEPGLASSGSGVAGGSRRSSKASFN